MVRQVEFSSTSRNNPVRSKIIDKRITLWYKTASDSDPPRHLVLLYPWLAAKDKHKRKYTEFYLDKGFDVLHVTLRPDQVFQPKRARAICRKVANLLRTDDTMQHQQVIAHTFSVGTYMHTQVTSQLLSDQGAFSATMGRMRGQIHDSPVGVDGAREGVPRALTKNKVLVAVMTACISGFLTTFSDAVTRYLQYYDVELRANRLAVPTLFLYSSLDPVCDTDWIEGVIRDMERQESVPIFSKMWPDSTHVNHMRLHPDEYIETVNMFLDRVGLNGQPNRSIGR